MEPLLDSQLYVVLLGAVIPIIGAAVVAPGSDSIHNRLRFIVAMVTGAAMTALKAYGVEGDAIPGDLSMFGDTDFWVFFFKTLAAELVGYMLLQTGLGDKDLNEIVFPKVGIGSAGLQADV